MKCFALGAAASSTVLLLSSVAFSQLPGVDEFAIRPNVVVIVLDDTGQEKLAIYNPPVPTPPTPQLTLIAQNGVRFTNAYANPLCSPTRATIMTGRYGFRTGMGTNTYPLPSSEVTIAELLKNGFPTQPQQYQCGAFGKWHLTTPNGNPMHAIIQGFDLFVGPMANVGNHFSWSMVTANAAGYTITQIGSPTGPFDETTFTASVVKQQAQAWINTVQEPFFAYVCFNPPHAPFQVPPLTTVSSGTANTITSLGFTPGQVLPPPTNDDLAYDWLVESVDTLVGRLIRNMPEARRLRTTFLIVGDNGTPMATIQVPPYQTAHAKGSVYEQGTLVPLIAYGRNVSSAGLACNGLVNTVDVWSTVAAVTGAQLPAGVTIDGVTFDHLMRNPSLASNRTEAFVQLYGPSTVGPYVPDPNNPPMGVTSHLRGINDGAYKYVRLGTSSPTEEAYDLVADPLETNDLWPILSTLPPAVQTRLRNLRAAMIALSGF